MNNTGERFEQDITMEERAVKNFLQKEGSQKREFVTIWILKGQTLTAITETNSKE